MTRLEEFDKSFTLATVPPSITFPRDVTPVLLTGSLPSLRVWAMEVPSDPSEQQLEAIRLKWFMDVDEMFYVGDEHASTPIARGLLNDPRFEGGSWELLTPIGWARKGLSGSAHPCKWLEYVGKNEFKYARSLLLFQLLWPKLLNPGLGPLLYKGGIVPLALKEVA